MRPATNRVHAGAKQGRMYAHRNGMARRMRCRT